MDLLLDNRKENTARDQCKLVNSLSKKHPEDASNLLKKPPRRCQKQPGKRKPGKREFSGYAPPSKSAKGAQKASRESFQGASRRAKTVRKHHREVTRKWAAEKT